MTHIKTATSDEAVDLGDEVMRQVGNLDQAAENLEGQDLENEVDPEKVGNWITVIGKALMAIFKP
ncbi:MAG: hypothetical protein AB7T49_19920 [Oligoflexales bacterium]